MATLNKTYVSPPGGKTAPTGASKTSSNAALTPVKIERILSASSTDPRHPPENIIDMADPKSFWISTGLYPQFVTLELARPVVVRKLMVTSTGVAQFVVEQQDHAADNQSKLLPEFTVIGSSRAQNSDQLQTTTISIQNAEQKPTRVVKLVLKKGFQEYSSLRKILVSE
ncbi:MAG: hypothetical protein SGCHY_002688 [Lobulomycetales sp.]